MKLVVLGALGMAACWSGSSKPLSNSGPGPGEIVVTEAEAIAGSTKKSEQQLARQQAIEQARAAGIIGPATPTPPPTGPLDKEAIRREVRAHLDPITLCYELRLLEDATLQGTTTVAFVIGADGSVTSATGSGFDASVDTCVADAVRGIAFPPPTGGGVMHVNYPFRFRPSP
jgi:TonB family protein